MSVVIDTNLLIYFLNGSLDPQAFSRVGAELSEGAAVSVITRMEVLGWRGHTASSRQAAEALLNSLEEISLTAPVVQRVIALRSSLAIKLPDAIIAASAAEYGLALMTHNTADFARVPGLSVVDPLIAQG